MILLISSYISYVVAEAILMSTLNIGFYEDLRKIIFQLSSNTHLISSSGLFKTGLAMLVCFSGHFCHFRENCLFAIMSLFVTTA